MGLAASSTPMEVPPHEYACLWGKHFQIPPPAQAKIQPKSWRPSPGRSHRNPANGGFALPWTGSCLRNARRCGKGMSVRGAESAVLQLGHGATALPLSATDGPKMSVTELVSIRDELLKACVASWDAAAREGTNIADHRRLGSWICSSGFLLSLHLFCVILRRVMPILTAMLWGSSPVSFVHRWQRREHKFKLKLKKSWMNASNSQAHVQYTCHRNPRKNSWKFRKWEDGGRSQCWLSQQSNFLPVGRSTMQNAPSFLWWELPLSRPQWNCAVSCRQSKQKRAAL